MIVIPDLHHVEPDRLQLGDVVRVSAGEFLATSDVYGFVRGIKRMTGGGWRIRWEAATVVHAGEPDTGILHVCPGGLVSCVTVEQVRKLLPRSNPNWTRPAEWEAF